MSRGAINRFRNWLARCIETPGRWTTDVPSRTYEVDGRRVPGFEDPTAIHLDPTPARTGAGASLPYVSSPDIFGAAGGGIAGAGAQFVMTGVDGMLRGGAGGGGAGPTDVHAMIAEQVFAAGGAVTPGPIPTGGGGHGAFSQEAVMPTQTITSERGRLTIIADQFRIIDPNATRPIAFVPPADDERLWLIRRDSPNGSVSLVDRHGCSIGAYHDEAAMLADPDLTFWTPVHMGGRVVGYSQRRDHYDEPEPKPAPKPKGRKMDL